MNPEPAFDATVEQARHWSSLLELSAKEVFQIMLGSALEPADIDQPAPSSEFTAMVGLAGHLCGVLTVRCSERSAASITSKMLGVSSEEVDMQMWDALGEVCNMVAGNFKNKLTGLADRCLLSPPTVITGDDYSFHALTCGTNVAVLLLFKGAPLLFSLEVHS